MQLNLLKVVVALAALATSSVNAIDNVAVYKFGRTHQQNIEQGQGQVPVLSQKGSILNLADEFDISSYYKIDSTDDLDAISIGKTPSELDSDELNKLILIINGVDQPDSFFEIDPIFTVESKDDRDFSQFNRFLTEFPKKLMNVDVELKLSQLSDIINLIGYSTNSVLNNLWNKYFHSQETNKLESFWVDLKDSFSLTTTDDKKHFKRSLNHVNDEQFINELTQLDFFLRENLLNRKEKIIINLNSLTTIFKKTGGVESQTYKTCKELIQQIISNHLKNNDQIESTIVVLPITQKELTLQFRDSNKYSSPMSLIKRDSSTPQIFASGLSCFSTQETCIESTSACSGHGLCSKIGECWKCVCSTTVDSESGRSSHWTGGACQKKDVSVEFNLLFWTTLILTAVFITGIKLLISCGSEELPGVLIAATVASKKTV
ncbi:hypothetical protein CANARDRAFT_194148 [[Candida] arabinofermentans NRRL YB-2248]|uniref:Uncharacterized protein n=1 Tax=[Candida] arabinofermentans NRRL YB-2248 TaxID=983967 RepID=A0A1E4T696_9ASCO|nr:hypothetical protein CANARDRAFT_194148 [[Candida] arabinofermentans NRRL YB-2248]